FAGTKKPPFGRLFYEHKKIIKSRKHHVDFLKSPCRFPNTGGQAYMMFIFWVLKKPASRGLCF
ncbi:TPA: hypothetical protein ACLT9F_002065, partial [Neisseria gonorrhoeae]